jgi:hypothetical protein
MAAGAGALLVAIGGGAAGVAALTKDDKAAPQVVTAVGQAAQAAPNDGSQLPTTPGRPAAKVPAQAQHDAAATASRLSDQADRTGTRAPRQNTGAVPPAPAKAAPRPAAPAGAQPPPAAAPAQPQTTIRTEVETREIPFETRLVRDPALPRGSRHVQAAGTPGEESLRYQVTVVDGQVTDRRLMDITVTRQPQPRVVAFGTSRHGQDRECRRGRGLGFCVPLGRNAACPAGQEKDEAKQPESALQLDGSVVVLDQDLELLDRLGC